MGKNSFRLCGFWVFAQIEKRRRNDRGTFKNFVPKIEEQWENLSQEERDEWKHRSLKLRQRSDLYTHMKRVHRVVRKGEGSPLRFECYKMMWAAALEDVYEIVSFELDMNETWKQIDSIALQ